MKFSHKALSLTILIFGSVGSVLAQEENARIWSGSGYLGLTSTSGNSDTESLTAGLGVKIETGNWIADLGLDILRASANDEDTAERYIIRSKTGYKLDDNDYLFYGSRYENDNFSGFDYTSTFGVGWGHKFVDTEKNRMISELSLGYKTQALDIDRTEINGLALIGKFDYMRAITDTTTFENVTLVESTSDNTFVQNDAGFSFKVSDKLAVKLAHQLRHNSEAPAGRKSTDTLVSANLVYDF